MAPRDRDPMEPTPPPPGPALVRPTVSALLISLVGVAHGGCSRSVGDPPMVDPGDASHEAVGEHDEGGASGSPEAPMAVPEEGGPDDPNREREDRASEGTDETPEGTDAAGDAGTPPMASVPMAVPEEGGPDDPNRKPEDGRP